MDCHLRPANASDREFLYQLHCRTMRDVIERTWGWEDEWQRADFERRLLAYVTSVIEVDGNAVGGVMLDPTPGAIDIVELQVLPEYQGKGIGTAVLQRVIDDAARQHLPVTLAVVPANPRAQRLYERVGFEVVGRNEPFILMQYGPHAKRPDRVSRSGP